MPGTEMLVSTPNGNFNLNPDTLNSNSRIILIGAGSGITPLISIIQTVLTATNNSTCELFYGSKFYDSIIYQTKLARLQLVYKDRLVIHHFLSKENSSIPENNSSIIKFHKGRVNQEYLSKQINQISKEQVHGVYLCGPAELIDSSISTLEGINIDKKKIHREYFTVPITDEPEWELDDSVSKTRTVDVTLDRKQIQLSINGKQNILQQLLDDGYDAPYSCLQGTCSTCKAKLVSGEVKMKVDIGLEDDEKDAGYILTCQSVPLTENVNCIYE